jgi:protein phosphatase 2C family protein 2/3
MFDHSEEDKDLASQVHKGPATSQNEPKSTSEKTEPNVKGVADGTLTNSTDSTEKKAGEKITEN